MEEKEIFLSRLEHQFAAAILESIAHLDPGGQTAKGDIEAMTKNGQCFAATAQESQAVYVLKVHNGVAWISAAKGFGSLDWTGHLLPIIEAQANGCESVAFQTKRRGLVRRAQAQGYEVAGWILKKAL